MELTGAVHGDAIGVAAPGHARLDLAGDFVEGVVPADRREVVLKGRAEQGLAQAAWGQGFADGGALDADLAKAGGVFAVAAGGPHRVALGIPFHGLTLHGRRQKLQATTHAAVGALAAHAAG